jgi:hypothetical protein
MIRFVEVATLREGTMFYTLEGALETYKRFKDFQDYAEDRCGHDDHLGDLITEVGRRIEELIKIRNTKEFSHSISDEKIGVPDGDYFGIWTGYTIQLKDGTSIRVRVDSDNSDFIRNTQEHPKQVVVHIRGGQANLYGYDI